MLRRGCCCNAKPQAVAPDDLALRSRWKPKGPDGRRSARATDRGLPCHAKHAMPRAVCFPFVFQTKPNPHRCNIRSRDYIERFAVCRQEPDDPEHGPRKSHGHVTRTQRLTCVFEGWRVCGLGTHGVVSPPPPPKLVAFPGSCLAPREGASIAPS